MRKAKQILTVAVLGLMLLGGMVLHLATPDQEFSRAERRRLHQLPELKAEALLSGEYAADLEAYLQDRSPMRDKLRTLKSFWSYGILHQRDVNGVFMAEGTASKLSPPLDPKQVQRFVDKMNGLHERYFPDSQITCVVVPDKNYYLTDGTSYPRFAYDELYAMVEEGLPWAEHLDIRVSLSAEDYYTTDAHWRQERLMALRDLLAEAMELSLPGWDTYRETVLPGFYGVYHGQAALPLPPEDLVYLENDVTDRAVVTGPELKGEQSVYAPERFAGLDGYDVFLHGPQAILTIEDPLAETDRELIIFRDSFGSSLAPLLLPGYQKITMIDIRYVVPDLLEQFVDFHGQEVMILYSTTMINAAGALK